MFDAILGTRGSICRGWGAHKAGDGRFHAKCAQRVEQFQACKSCLLVLFVVLQKGRGQLFQLRLEDKEPLRGRLEAVICNVRCIGWAFQEERWPR